MWQLKAAHVPPSIITAIIQGKPVDMELDIRAGVSVIGEKGLREALPNVKLTPSIVWTPVQGWAEILVKYKIREVLLPLFVVGGTSPTLLGRNFWWSVLS
ncbi:uncharacterized protein ISCGN_032314 [Ixodes scapularis]